MKIIHFASSIRHVGRSHSKQHENVAFFFPPNGSYMKHVTLRSSSATNAGSGQASGKHSQLSLPFPFCHCCHPQFLTQFLCVCASTAIGALDRFRVARPLTCRLWSPYSMRRRYILFILFTRFFFIFCFCFSLRLWFHRLPRGLCKAFFTLFRFFSVFFVTCEVVKVKIDFHFIAACA